MLTGAYDLDCPSEQDTVHLALSLWKKLQSDETCFTLPEQWLHSFLFDETLDLH